MRVRTLLIAGMSTVAAAALSLVPVAQANNPTGGPVAGVTNPGAVTLTAKLPLAVRMKVYGTYQTLGCTSGTATATANAGPSPWLNFTGVNLTCLSLLPGSTTSISIPNNGCANVTLNDNNVHAGLVDTGLVTDPKFDAVSGMLNLPVGCNVTVVMDICTITLGGSTPIRFDEAVKPNGSQDFYLLGTGLTVRSASPLCFGMVSVGDQLDLGNQTNPTPRVQFNLSRTNGLPIDVFN